jgi:hypothetical protein
MTGGRLGFRVDGEEVTNLLVELIPHLEVCDLDSGETLQCLQNAKSGGIRGGRVHDYLHAMAAVKAECERVYTYNVSDFEGLSKELEIMVPV